MEFMERYWSMASDITGIISLLMEGWMFGFFVKPFLLKLQSARISGIVYAMLMVILYILPMEFEYPRIIVCFTTFCVLGVLDRKNMAQKSVLVIMMYLFSWIAHGVALIPRNVLYTLLIDNDYVTGKEMQQFIGYVMVEVLFCIIKGILLYLLVFGMHRVYTNKRENISRKGLFSSNQQLVFK